MFLSCPLYINFLNRTNCSKVQFYLHGGLYIICVCVCVGLYIYIYYVCVCVCKSYDVLFHDNVRNAVQTLEIQYQAVVII